MNYNDRLLQFAGFLITLLSVGLLVFGAIQNEGQYCPCREYKDKIQSLEFQLEIQRLKDPIPRLHNSYPEEDEPIIQ